MAMACNYESPTGGDEYLPFQLPQRSTALSLFLGSVRTSRTWGIGDFTALAQLSTLAAESGFDVLAVGPISAVPFVGAVPPSPYSPASRLWFNVSHIDVERVPGFDQIANEVNWRRVRALNTAPYSDPTAVRDIKMTVLRRIFDSTAPHIDIHASLARRRYLHEYALHGALSGHFGPDWRSWPPPYKSRFSPHVERWAEEHWREVRFIAWCALLGDRQLADAASTPLGCQLVLDLPVATPHSSADSWIWQWTTALDVDLGAPPDYIDPKTSRWPLAPMDPGRLRQQRFEPFSAVLDACFIHAHGVRIDHAYGLFRQYWLDRDRDAGYFVEQPSAELLQVIGRSARRHRGWVAMEELGPEPPGAEGVLRDAKAVSQRPFVTDQFDPGCQESWVGVTSHDLPTLRAFIEPESQVDGWILSRAFYDRASKKLSELVPCIDRISRDEVCSFVLAALDDRFKPYVLSASLDDVIGETRPYNLPGTTSDRYPNFLRAYPLIDEIEAFPSWLAVGGVVKGRRTR